MEYSQDDIRFGLEVSNSVAEMRQDNNPNNIILKSKFKVGDLVKYIGNGNYPIFYRDNIFPVSSVAQEDENTFEYSLSGFPYLVWENELMFYSFKCKHCGTHNQDKNNCKKCGAPYSN